jgi:hypothetical protein
VATAAAVTVFPTPPLPATIRTFDDEKKWLGCISLLAAAVLDREFISRR